MQAPLSSTASGKLFRTGPLTALLSVTSHASLNPKRLKRGLMGETDSPHLFPSHSIAEGKGLAHDAGNLLGALGLYCELLALPGVLREEHRHYAEELHLLSERSRELIDRLLHPSTTEQRTQRKHVALVPEVIEGCRGVLNAVARRVVSVMYEAGTALPVAISPESLERILVNLTKNAAEAMEDTPHETATILLRVSRHRDAGAVERIVLTIEDKGCGMSMTAMKALLDEGNVAGLRSSRGIGFQVVRELVGASGGQLRLTSRIGRGTTVSIMWPVVDGLHVSAIGEAPSVLPNALEERRRLMAIARHGQRERLSC